MINNMGPGALAITVENTSNYSTIEINSPAPRRIIEKVRTKNLKQCIWILLLRASKIASFFAWCVSSFESFLIAIKNRLFFSKNTKEPEQRGRLLRFVRAILAISLLILLLELAARLHNWDLPVMISSEEVGNLAQLTYLLWLSFRANYIAPLVIALSRFCTILFMVQSLDRLVLCLGCLWIKLKNLKPRIDGNVCCTNDVLAFPMVLVQIPMCNEREVYMQSIAAACQLDWPKERLLIQILDDSDEEITQLLIKREVFSWSQKGVNIIYRHRYLRTGYKAGNLNSAMACEYVKDYEFVALFDADFKPNPDFLKLTIPHFKDNPGLGLVQARWSYVNKDENLLTRLQNINLCFHFEVEQQVNGVFLNFFGFNGTAGVWRIKALQESGGWLERTTVEDMDIAVRAHLKGWKFIFLNDVKVLCELPESYEAYKKQQHRWHSGPMQLFRLCLPSIIASKISVWKKCNLVLLFFLLRKLILPFYSFTLFCIILPSTMFIPEAELPIWLICYIPIFMSLLNILPSPKSFPFIIPYLLFENTMSVTKFDAMVSGLFQLGSAYEWVVTKKTGRSSESDLLAIEKKSSVVDQQQYHHKHASESDLEMLSKMEELHEIPSNEMKKKKKKKNRIHRKELALALLLLTASARSLLSAHGVHFYFLLFQGLSFLIVGLDLIGD